MKKDNKKILFICPYPYGTAGGQRFRYEQYLELLKNNQIDYHVQSFLSSKVWDVLYKDGYQVKKFLGILNGFFLRTLLLFSVHKYDYVFIYREASPLGPPIFEYFIAKILKKRIIYDFDDAIWISNTSSVNSIASFFKNTPKVSKIIKWSYKVSVGNSWLKAYASNYNSSVIINPTTIDLNYHRPNIKEDNNAKEYVHIGWTGTHSTIKYIEHLIPVFEKIVQIRRVKIIIICDQPLNWNNEHLIQYKWHAYTEIEHLNEFDIGLMPLTNDQWAMGKCGFKAIQYLSLEIPAIVSPVGVNETIVQHDVNGYHVTEPKDWEKYILKLVDDKEKRMKMGLNGRKYIAQHYSYQSNAVNFLSLFD